jgi:hypothetical protein
VLKAVHQLMGNVDPAGKDTSLLSEYRKELRELRQNLETQGFLADESQASDEIAVHITELTAAYPVETEGTRVVPSVDSSTGNRLLSRVRSGAKKKR